MYTRRFRTAERVRSSTLLAALSKTRSNNPNANQTVADDPTTTRGRRGGRATVVRPGDLTGSGQEDTAGGTEPYITLLAIIKT
jgi:hypothetical protein